MTCHIHYDHKCSSCGADYIPFDRTVACPKCGLLESEPFDFIEPAAHSANINMSSEGSYLPSAWGASSLGDHLLYLVFSTLENHRQDTTGQSFSEIASARLAKVDWGDRPYLKEHVHAIACRVRMRLLQEKTAINKTREEQRENLFSTVRMTAFGAAAMLAPAAALSMGLSVLRSETGSSHESPMPTYFLWLIVALFLVSLFSWISVRFGGIHRKTAVVLTTFPFGLLAVASLSLISYLGVYALIPILICAAQLIAAIFAAAMAANATKA